MKAFKNITLQFNYLLTIIAVLALSTFSTAAFAQQKQQDVANHTPFDATPQNTANYNTATTAVAPSMVMPGFPGGFGKLQKYLYKKINYKGDFTGSALVMFNIETDGSLTGIKILNATEKDLDEKILAVLNQSPKWTPVIKDGQPIRSDYTFAINFPQQHK